MAEYLSKILLADLKRLHEKGILEAGIKELHLINLKERGYIIVGNVSGDPGWVLSEKGIKAIESK